MKPTTPPPRLFYIALVATPLAIVALGYTYCEFAGWRRLLTAAALTLASLVTLIFTLRTSRTARHGFRRTTHLFFKPRTHQSPAFLTPDRAMAIALFILAAVGVAERLQRHPLPLFQADSGAYMEAALLVEAGEPPVALTSARSFAYPLFIAAVYAIKPDLAALVRTQEFLSLIAALFTALAVRNFLSLRTPGRPSYAVALLATLAFAALYFAPSTRNYEHTVMAEAISTPAIAILLFLSSLTLRFPRLIWRDKRIATIWITIAVLAPFLFFIKSNWAFGVGYPILLLFAHFLYHRYLSIASIATLLAINLAAFGAFSTLENKVLRTGGHTEKSYMTWANLLAYNRDPITSYLSDPSTDHPEGLTPEIAARITALYRRADPQLEGKLAHVKSYHRHIQYDGNLVFEALYHLEKRDVIWLETSPESRAELSKSIVLGSMATYPTLWLKKVSTELINALLPFSNTYNPTFRGYTEYDLNDSARHMTNLLTTAPESVSIRRAIEGSRQFATRPETWPDPSTMHWQTFQTLNQFRPVLAVLSLSSLLLLLCLHRTIPALARPPLIAWLTAQLLTIGPFVAIAIVHVLTYPRYRELVLPATLLAHASLVYLVAWTASRLATLSPKPSSDQRGECPT